MNTSVGHLLAAFESFGQQPAIIWRDQRFTYEWLREHITRWTAELGLRADTQPGSVVALTADYSPTAIALLLALINSGCIVSLTITATPGQKAELFRLAEVSTEIVVDSEDEVVFRDIGHHVTHPLLAKLAASGTGGVVLFTSGSAGKIKAVVHDAERLLARCRTPTRARITIPFMLFDHIGGINTVPQVLGSGGTAVIAADRDPKTICSLIEKHRVQLLPATPTFLTLLLLSDFKEHDLSSLEIIAYGAERMPAQLLARLTAAFPGVRLIQNYGLSEVGVVRTSSDANGSLWVSLVGDGIETRVAHGLLEIKSDSAMMGYLNEASPFTEDGWLKTGDRVEVKGEHIQFRGRDSDVINIGGEKVYPSEIEDLIASMPHVIEVIVSAQSNAITGHLVHAEVRLLSEETREEFRGRMIAFLSDRIPSYKIPQRVTLGTQSFQGPRLKGRRS
ncbi:MAG: long-chain fatty acid--CoA ligase [Gemmatimonas sp.]